MKSKFLLPIILLVCLAPVIPAYSQVAMEHVTKVRWQEEELAPGIIHMKYQDTLFGSSQCINALQILLNDQYKINIAYFDSGRITLEKLAEGHNAIAAVNGTFFNMKKGGAVVFLQANNKIIDPPNHAAPAHIRRAALAINNTSVAIIKEPATGWLDVSDQYQDIMVSGPLLVHNNYKVAIDSNTFNHTRHPRSAVCVNENSQLILIAVDGRHAGKAVGMTISELQELTELLDCKDAINLDGGGSTTLWYKSKGVINFPSDNKKFDHQGARAIANGLIIVPLN